MQPRGPLMVEHRLIERMLYRIRQSLRRFARLKKVDPLFVDAAVDFFRFYADRTHHGKEEDILFMDLEKKNLAADDRAIMDELAREHAFGRKLTSELIDANERYRAGNDSAMSVIMHDLRNLSDFYPEHIKKEDEIFFPLAMKYLDEEEQQAMLAEFHDFDRKMIHEKYAAQVTALEKG